MKQECLVAATSKSRRYGSYMGEISPAPDNVRNRDFSAAAPNEKWLSILVAGDSRFMMTLPDAYFLSASPVGPISVSANRALAG